MSELLEEGRGSSDVHKILWGRAVLPERAARIRQEKTSEIGDILYYISAAGALRDIKLCDFAASALRMYTGKDISGSTIAKFDEHLRGRQVAAVAETYNPDYLGMQFFNFPVLETSQGQSTPAYEIDLDNSEPLKLIADGYFAVERLARDFEEGIARDSSDISREYFVQAGGLLLGALSIVAQSRLDSSLWAAAINNTTKLQRRAKSKTLSGGADAERSRSGRQPRPELVGFETTIVYLLMPLPASPETEPIEPTGNWQQAKLF